jgi:organic radical activating enzyme
MIEKQNFCILPWIHLASWNDGKVPLCCIAMPEQGINLNSLTPEKVWNSEPFKKARLEFLAGQKLPQCRSCWKEEDAGMKSHRMIENFMWQKKLGTDYLENLIASTNPDGSVNYNPITLDLRIGNTCNLQCVMCRPRDSSKWLSDSRRLADILTSPEAKNDWKFKSISITNTDCFGWFERLETQQALDEFMGDIRHIIFGGGEPLLIKNHERFITKLVETGHSKNIELRYHTNATVLSEKFIELWSQFKQVELLLSIDDWGQRNDYIRYPSDWNDIVKNLDRLDETSSTIVVNILTTVHAMNIYTLPEFASEILNRNWKKICRNNGDLFSVGTTHWPQYMSTRVLPTPVKQAIVERWNSFPELQSNEKWRTRISSQLEYMLADDDSNKYSALLDYIDGLDSIRSYKFSKLYSEYYELLKKHT